MTRQERENETAHIKSEANAPKHRLIELMSQLEDIGNKKEAERLEKIIIRLEVWQNT